MHVDIKLAARKVGGLGIGQRGRAFGRARRRAGNGNLDAGILADFGGAVEMRGRCRTAEAGIGQLPGELLGRSVVIDIGGPGAGPGGRRGLLLAVERCFVFVGKGRSCKSN